MESEVVKAENEKKLREMKIHADIAIENQKKVLFRAENR